MILKKLLSSGYAIAVAVILAALAGYLNLPIINGTATAVSDVFLSLLKLVSVPIIFLSIVSTISGMENVSEVKNLGKKVVKYTLITTVVASAFALSIFVLINPVRTHIDAPKMIETIEGTDQGYFHFLLQIIPSNFVQPFLESQVISVLFLAILLSVAILALPENNRKILHSFFSSLYAAVMKIVGWIVIGMPIAIWAFITLFIKDMRAGLEIESLALYLTCVLVANLVQGFIVLPSFLKLKGLSPVKLFRAMAPALSVAFFTKSSAATLPMAMKCAEENAGIPRKIASFTLPLCTTINMNACAAFILTTVLFVSMSNGMVYSPIELVLWIFIATIAAVGNAGVPMGCFFLSSAFLAAMNVPLNILGIILPFYALVDMLETAINVWSDSCVLAVVNKELKDESAVSVEAPLAVS
jgi:Na+/H+-dicarboxylate symporter